jgi:hypothetical protein
VFDQAQNNQEARLVMDLIQEQAGLAQSALG